jgi:hypothetical protein
VDLTVLESPNKVRDVERYAKARQLAAPQTFSATL